MLFRAYCVDKAHRMLPCKYYGNVCILCRLGTQYATLVVS